MTDTSKNGIMDGVVVVDAIIPTATAISQEPQLIRVIAPSNLAPGYQFEAESEGKRYNVTVPEGGVKEGQEFTAKATQLPEILTGHSTTGGSWKDGICNCCTYGCCHTHLCLTWFCLPIALAQVMTRMRLNFTAQRGSVSEIAKTFQTVVGIFICSVIVDQCLALALVNSLGVTEYDAVDSYDANTATGTMMMLYYLRQLVSLSFTLYLLISLYRTRKAVREQYNIPGDNCEDVCCTLFCTCCTTMQLMRQTADYDTYAASCCTETGLPSHVAAAGNNNVPVNIV